MLTLRGTFGWALASVAIAGCGSGGGAKGTSAGDAGASGPPGTIMLWTTGLGPKVQPTTAPGTTASISVSSARAAWASAQLVVYGKGGPITQASVAVPADLSDGAGHTLAKSNLTFFLEGFIDFTGVSSNTGNVPVPASSPTKDGNLPDPLIPMIDPYTGANLGQPFTVAAGTNQPVWVDIFVPTGTTAGTYAGTLQVTAGANSASVPISVTVWDIDLPDMRTVTTHFKMSTNALLEYHSGIATCDSGNTNCYLNDNAKCLSLVKRYEELAHEHRVDTGQMFVQDPGEGCDVPTDWTTYDGTVAPYMSGSYWTDGVPSSRIDAPFSPGETYGYDACTQSQYVALSSAWASHFKTNGWFDRSIVYAYDEPPESAYAAIAQGSSWLQQGDPDWKAHVLDTVSPASDDIATLGPAIGIFTVNMPHYANWALKGNYGRSDWTGLFTQGDQLWFYESNSVLPPYPTFASNTMDGLEPVMAMWGSWYEKATGFLYWDIAGWDDKSPWGPNIDFDLTGDGVLVYPGNHDGTLSPAGSPANVAIDGPIPSYRLKMVRNGLQDWALFKVADTKGLTSMVQTQMAAVYSQLGGCTYSGCPASPGGFFWKTDEAQMNAIRSTVAAAIVAAGP